MTAAQTLADVAAAYLINAQARADLQDSSDQSREAALHDPADRPAQPGADAGAARARVSRAVAARARSRRCSSWIWTGSRTVNDTHGHQVGDELLVAVAQRLTGLLRPGDTLARLSGDEFVILCEDLDDPAAADAIAARLDAELARPFVLSGVEVNSERQHRDRVHRATASTHPRSSCTTRIWRCTGQSATAAAATTCSTCASCISPGTKPVWRAACPGAIGRGELHLDYQPIVDSRTTAASPASRRCCAGRTRLADRSPRRCSSRSPSSPGRSSSSGGGCSSRPAQTVTTGSSTRRRHRDVGQRVRPPVHVGRLRRRRSRRCSPSTSTDPSC